MSTTRRCRCWRRAPARPRPGGCGLMFATSGRSPAPARQRRCSITRPTAKANIPGRICKTSGGSSTPTAIPGSTDCLPATGSARPPAGPMSAANFLTSTPPTARQLPSRPSTASASSMGSKRRLLGCRLTSGAPNATNAQSRLPKRCAAGPRRPCQSSRANPSWPRPSATCAHAGRRCCAASMTAGSPSTTIRPSGRCAASRRGAHYAALPQASGNIGI